MHFATSKKKSFRGAVYTALMQFCFTLQSKCSLVIILGIGKLGLTVYLYWGTHMSDYIARFYLYSCVVGGRRVLIKYLVKPTG